MKKLVTILTATVILFSTSAFASDGEKVNARVIESFFNDFSAASNVSWERSSDFSFATFTINSIEVNAAYNEAGELVGTSRPMESSQLPLSVTMALTKRFQGYNISKKAMELSFEGDTHYYLNVANDKQVLKLKCSVYGNIEVEQKIKYK